MAENVEVIIVGAGLSGITTAWALKQAGISSVLLEGRPRFGGRIHTSYKWDGIPIELGASWVTHLVINPLVDIARANKIKLTKSDLFHLNLFPAKGDDTPLPNEDVNDLLVTFGLVYAGVKAEADARRRRGRPDVALSKVLPDVMDAFGLKKQKRLGVEYFLNMSIFEPYVANADDLSLYEWDDDYTLAPAGWRVVPDGFIKIVDVLAKGLDIRLEHVVTTVAYDKNEVIVETKNHGSFRAPHAVITVPHGVLASKKKLIKFEPKLPPWKQAAIDRVHTDVSDKFWFLFPRKFWKSTRDVVGRIDANGNGEWSTWVNFHRYTKQPVLMVFNRTEHARALEEMSDQAVIDEAMKILRAEYGRRTPDPIDMQRSTWLSDPFSSGTLPHLSPGATSADHDALGRAVGRVHFAGDSTVSDFPGMTLGAYWSGIREAGKLIEAIYLGKIGTDE